jgi:hypothetical protein
MGAKCPRGNRRRTNKKNEPLDALQAALSRWLCQVQPPVGSFRGLHSPSYFDSMWLLVTHCVVLDFFVSELARRRPTKRD